MPIHLSPLSHIEIVVRDATAAADFLVNTFEASKTQENVTEWLNEAFAGLVKVVHVALGQVVLQFVEPLSEEGLFAEFLRQHGPGVHNLSFMVDNVQEATEILISQNVPTLWAFQVDWTKLFGQDNVRANVPPVHMLGSEEIIGFRIEFFENPQKEQKG